MVDMAQVESEACHTQADSLMPANILNLPRLTVTQVDAGVCKGYVKTP